MSRSRSLREWKRTSQIVVSIILFAGYCVGLYFASYNRSEGKLNVYMFIVLILASIIGIYVVLQLFWWLKGRRSRGSFARMHKVMELRKEDLVDEKTIFIEESVLPILGKINAVTLRITEDLFPRVIFEFPKNHQYVEFFQPSANLVRFTRDLG